ncbi:DegT/DnrJ/EryC1/StrS family aminotransferase [Streptomyces sp. MP131-18]|uniref:DegT/DnrJ/EryC1/StrS family aminotransferase n=1 Tax=Streptomyces sp. MP131-18 TaxID=1857892 RepID=UPI00097BBF49|nr:DegT/DnrJ/EryC1/StrS family aminotransferase [Streptomyces sp. MP131-18]ONK10487.1 3-amino-5-hydroxybenzoate synthase [Streptomyces sp. MP131-18]
MPGPGWYLIDDAEEREVVEALREGHLSRYRFGDESAVSKTMRFEREMAALLGSPHALAVNSCTSALVAGLTGLGVGPGDEVIVPGYTFIASIAAVLFTGARPVLAEIDESLTLAPDDVAAKLGPRTKAIMPVHMMGAPADLDRLLAVADGIPLLEDCAQACGGSYRGRRLGTIGAAGAFSFNTGKTMTTGDGGLLVTESPEVYRQAFAFHDHGFAPDRAGLVEDGPRMGLNLRMHELAAALGLAQVRKLDRALEHCRELAAVVREGLDGVPGVGHRVIHDEGWCGTAHVLIFEEPARATAFARELGGSTLDTSTKHNYARAGQLHVEFTRTDANGERRIRNAAPGDLPRTDALLSRSVALSVGVVDGYLGTLGEVTVRDTAQEAAAKTAKVREALLRTASPEATG